MTLLILTTRAGLERLFLARWDRAVHARCVRPVSRCSSPAASANVDWEGTKKMTAPADLLLLRAAHLREVSILQRNDEAYVYAMAAEAMERTVNSARKRRCEAEEAAGNKRACFENNVVQQNYNESGSNGAFQRMTWPQG